MTARGRALTRVSLLAAATLLASGCTQLTNPMSWPTLKLGGNNDDFSDVRAIPTPVVDGSAPGLTTQGGAAAARNRPVVVRRGQAIETLSLVGSVAGDNETQLRLPSPFVVGKVPARVGGAVEQGQDIVLADTTELEKQIDAVKARLDATKTRLAQIQATGAETERKRLQDEATKRQRALAAAEASVAAAEAELKRAQSTPPSADERKALADAAEAARQNYNKAIQAKDALLRPPDAAQVRAAERDMVRAQADVDKAKDAVTKLTSGPDPDTLKILQRDVTRAQENLNVAQIDRNASASSLLAARRALEDAQEKLRVAQLPPKAADVSAARTTQRLAELDLQGAKEKYAALVRPPDITALAAAQEAINKATDAVQTSEQRLNDLMNKPSSTAVAAAQAKLDQAQAAYKQVQIEQGPEPDPAATTETTGADIVGLNQAIQTDQGQLDKLQDELTRGRVTAPFAGVVTDILVRTGDRVAANSVVATIARTGAPTVKATLTDKDAAQVQVSQKGIIRLGADAGDRPLNGEVIAVTGDPQLGETRVAQFKVDWPEPQLIPRLGTSVDVTLTVRQKDDVLLVPSRAVTNLNGRTFVEVVEGNNRRTVAVETGMQSGADVEIRSGLREGQVVFVPR